LENGTSPGGAEKIGEEWKGGTPGELAAKNGADGEGTPGELAAKNGGDWEGTPGELAAKNGGGWEGTPGELAAKNGGEWEGTPGELAAKNGGGWEGTPGELAAKTGGKWEGASPGELAEKNGRERGGDGGSPSGKCLANTRAALLRSPGVPAETSMTRSLTYLPCVEATEAAVAGMEAMVKQRRGRKQTRGVAKTNKGVERATVQKHPCKLRSKNVCWIWHTADSPGLRTPTQSKEAQRFTPCRFLQPWMNTTVWRNHEVHRRLP
jgi:hypothetical protein